MSIEESYSISDAIHDDGTNRYTFKFNPQWRNKIKQQLHLGIRSIKLWLSPRLLWMEGLSINEGSHSYNISPQVIVTNSMTEANTMFKNDIQKHIEFEDTKLSYSIYYHPSSNSLVFETNEI